MRHLERRKYIILKSGHFWRISVRIAERIRREFALRNYTPQLSVLFVTVHPNAIVVTIRISIAGLIGGGGNTDIFPGRQTPSRRHCKPEVCCRIASEPLQHCWCVSRRRLLQLHAGKTELLHCLSIEHRVRHKLCLLMHLVHINKALWYQMIDSGQYG